MVDINDDGTYTSQETLVKQLILFIVNNFHLLLTMGSLYFASDGHQGTGRYGQKLMFYLVNWVKNQFENR